MLQTFKVRHWWEWMVLLGTLLVLGAILLPVFAQACAGEGRRSCASNAKQQNLALQMYAQDFDGHLPDSRWVEKLRPYVKNDSLFDCPPHRVAVIRNFYDKRVDKTPFAHALLTPRLGARLDTIPRPMASILTLETSRPGINALDDGTGFAARHGDLGWGSFADGHVKALTPAELAQRLAPP